MGIAASVRSSSVISVPDHQDILLGSCNWWSAPSYHAQPTFQRIDWVSKGGPDERRPLWFPFSFKSFSHEAESGTY